MGRKKKEKSDFFFLSFRAATMYGICFGIVESYNTTINSWGCGDKQIMYMFGQGGGEKEKFNFASFSSYFDTATIAAGKKMEKVAAREPEWTPPRRRTPLTRTAVGPGGGYELATMVDNAAVQSDVASADNAGASR